MRELMWYFFTRAQIRLLSFADDDLTSVFLQSLEKLYFKAIPRYFFLDISVESSSNVSRNLSCIAFAVIGL